MRYLKKNRSRRKRDLIPIGKKRKSKSEEEYRGQPEVGAKNYGNVSEKEARVSPL